MARSEDGLGRQEIFAMERHSIDSDNSGDRMSMFRKSNTAKSVIFAVNYDDARTAYLWIDDLAKANDNRAVSLIARSQQEKGSLPEGTITSVKRVR
jgi:hypothetical protein